MLNSVGKRTPPWGTSVFNGCVVSVCCIGFDVVCDEFYDCVWNVCM